MDEHDLVVSPDGAPELRQGMLLQVLRAQGSLDATTDEALLAGVRTSAGGLAARSRVAAGPRPDRSRAVLVLVLDQVRWCDSRGLGALVRAVSVAVQEGVSLRLVAAPDSAAARIVTRVAMAEVLSLASSVDDVLAAPHPCPLETELDPS